MLKETLLAVIRCKCSKKILNNMQAIGSQLPQWTAEEEKLINADSS